MSEATATDLRQESPSAATLFAGVPVLFTARPQFCEAQAIERDLMQNARLMGKDVIEVFSLLREVDTSPELVDISRCKTKELLEIDVRDNYSPKMEWLFGFLGELRPDEKVVIFTAWANMAHILGRLLPQSIVIDGTTKNRQNLVDDFNEGVGGWQFLIATDCLAYGANIDGADRLVNFDVHPNPQVLKQRSERIHRLTSTRPKFIYNLIGGGVELHIHRIMQDKTVLAENVASKVMWNYVK